MNKRLKRVKPELLKVENLFNTKITSTRSASFRCLQKQTPQGS